MLVLLACNSGPLDKVADPVADAGERDGGTTVVTPRDGGVQAPPRDAGPDRDAGPPRDAGAPPPVDAGEPIDGGVGPGPMAEGCITDVTPGNHEFTCDGLVFHVSMPAACVQSGCGLILDVHGLSMSGPMQENNTNLAALTQNLDFVVAQPSATPRPPLAGWTPGTDDPKMLAFIDLAKRVYQIDDGRVHFTGFSQGGYMSWRFICANSDLFASVAPAAATIYSPAPGAGGCNFTDQLPAQELSILYMHGTRDALVDPAGAQPQIDAVIAAWGFGAGTVVSMDNDYVHRRYENANGTIFETVLHDYVSDATSNIPLVPDIVGHCYPGSTDPGDEQGQLYSFKCEPPNAFHWGEMVLDFFSRTSR